MLLDKDDFYDYIGIYLQNMKGLFTSACLVALLMISCSEEKSRTLFKKKDKYQPFILNMQHYFSESEFNVSFPIWFNDTIIKNKGIEKITRKIYGGELDGEGETATPKEIKTYLFNKEGQLLSIHIEQFYENVKVADITFDYLSPKDEHGFAEVQRKRERNVSIDELAEENFKIYEKESYNEKFLVYNNYVSGDYLFYLLKEKYWGVVAVDSILNPTPRDIVTLGNTFYPTKVYQVENTVNELNVVKYTYDKSARYIKSIVYNEYPFHTKRDILYDQNGGCHGYIDSIFTDDKFLKRSVSTFEMELDIPVRVNHGKQATDSLSGIFQYETFEYQLFEKRKKGN